MKKLIAIVFAAAALTASAAWEKVGSLEIAGTDALVAAVTRLGKFTGNEMLGTMASGTLMQSEPIQFFGPTRTGRSVLLPIYIDGSKINPVEIAKDPKEAFEHIVEFAVLYPVVATKAKFLKHHAGAIETNGYIRVSDEDDAAYVKFSADGKWAALSDKSEQVDLALAEAAKPRPALDGDLVRFTIDAKGMKVVRDIVEELARNPSNGIDRTTLDVVRGFSALALSVRVGDAGLDYRWALKTVAGTEFAKIGTSALPADPLGFAGKEALAAFATAKDCGEGEAASEIRNLLNILRRHGLTAEGVSCTKKDATTTLALDIATLGNYVRREATNALEKVDWEKLGEYVKTAFTTNKGFRAAGPANNFIFTQKGAALKYTAAERFAATLPDGFKDHPYKVGVFSLLSYFRVLMPELLKFAPEEEAASLQPLLAMLPEETRGAIAGAYWRKGDMLLGLVRISADEFKGISTAVTAFMAYSAAKGGCDDDGGDCDEDDSDDDPDDAGKDDADKAADKADKDDAGKHDDQD